MVLSMKTIRKAIKHYKVKRAQNELFRLKKDQKFKVEFFSKQFNSLYNEVKMYDVSRFCTQTWKEINIELEKEFLPDFPISFLRNKNINETMFVDANWISDEIAFLESRITKKMLKEILKEDYLGDPILHYPKYLTSHNSIHQLYHLLRFSEKSDIFKIKNIVEWGGGYGCMAKIFRRLSSDEMTYTIVDTPLFSCIQWLYLTITLGEECINIITSPKQKINMNKINLLPLCFLEKHTIQTDLFIALWSLSESSKYSQDYVASCNFFNSKYFLIAYQDNSLEFPDADRIKESVVEHGVTIEDIEFLPGNYYAFK